MSQAFFTAMSGIKTAQTQLSVVSNNIANMNTTAFKSSSVNFSDVFYSTLSYGSGSNPSSNLGGTNPQQVGVGVQLGAVATNYTNGSWQSTGLSSDLCIQGNGFFTVMNSNGGTCFTRDGSFSLDSAGYLVTASGNKVLGAENSFGLSSSAIPIKIPTSITTKTIANETDLATKKISDLNGTEFTTGTFYADISYVDAGGLTQTISDILIDTSSAVTMGDVSSQIQTALRAATGTDFNPNDISVTCDNSTGGVLNVTSINNTKITFKSSNSSNVAGTSDFLVATELAESSSAGGVTTYDTKTLDYKQIIDFATSATSSSKYGSMSIATDGSIIAEYSNGDKLSVSIDETTGKSQFKYTTSDYIVITGDDVVANPMLITPANLQIQMADFVNTNGLLACGSNMYEMGENCGQAYFGIPSTNSFGGLASGGLESSNVDLSREFSNMIIAQRAIQANSRVFSTASSVMETLSYLGQ